MASEGAAPASQVPVPDTSPEEEFDLFGPSMLGVDQVELVLRTLLLSLRRLQLRLRLPEALLEAKGVRLDSFSKQLVVLLLLEFLPLLLRVQERTFKASFWRCLGNRTRRPWKCCVSKA